MAWSGKRSTIRNFNLKRIPLGGKDLNKSIPQLNKAKSTLLDIKSRNISLQRKPLLQKANSTLGFWEQKLEPQSLNLLPKIQNKELKVSISSNIETTNINSELKFNLNSNSKLGNLPVLLPPTTQTINDSLIKKELKPLPPLQQSLIDTLSSNTHKLHASNVPSLKITQEPSKIEYQLPREQLIEELSNDPSSIETLPVRKHIIEKPDGMDLWDKDDLDFFSQTSRKLVVENEDDLDLISKYDEELELKELDLDDPEIFEFDGMTMADMNEMVNDI